MSNYVDNKRLKEELTIYADEYKKAKEAGEERPVMSNYIGECIIKIANGFARKPNFSGYTYKEEMVSDAIENCVMYVHNFNPEKSNSAFAYITQIVYYAFIRRIDKEKKQVKIKRKYVEKAYVGEIDSLITGDHEQDNEFKNTLLEYLEENYLIGK